jgi:hypothetical protein
MRVRKNPMTPLAAVMTGLLAGAEGTATAWRGNRKRRWRERPAGLSPVPGRPRWRRSRAQRTPYPAGTSGPVTAIADNSDWPSLIWGTFDP